MSSFPTALSGSVIVALLALCLDWVFGDPPSLPHPVKLIGWAINRCDLALHTGRPQDDLVRGGILTVSIVTLAAGLTQLIVFLSGFFGGLVQFAVAATLAWTTIALRGLDDAAAEVEMALVQGNLDAARAALPALVGRDTESLDQEGIIRAVIESVAENTSDGVVAPLLFLIMGGPAAAMAYKAINTLDSMIGHRDERYLFFGKVAARLDDVANYIPARLTAICLALAAVVIGRGAKALSAALTYGSCHPSPNAGYPEAAMAGALGVRLGGPVSYGGEVEFRPYLGECERELDIGDINLARRLLRYSSLVAFLILVSLRWAISS